MFYKWLVNLICQFGKYLIVILKMGNNNNKVMEPYVFKIFRCEKIIPNLSLSSKVPLPRSGHRIVCDTTNMYSFGGYNPLTTTDDFNRDDDEVSIHSFPLFQELWKFNCASKRWKRYAGRQSLPNELASNAVVREGNYLMVYGGTGSPFGYRCSNQLYICRLNDEKGQMFEVLTTGKHPLPQYGQALVYHNNYLYTIGGTTGFAYTCDIHRLNINKKEWENVYICQGQFDHEPEGRYRHEVAFDNENIYILGGGTANEAFDFHELYIFNIELREWRKCKTLQDNKAPTNVFYQAGIPPPRRCHGAVQIPVKSDVHVFISGGYDGEIVFDDLWRLELSTLRWTFINTCKLPQPTYFHSTSVTPEGKMYLFGGIFATNDIRRSNDVYATWLCIPKLSEICWEALLHYYPRIVNYPKEKLINAGLPRNFIQRIE